MSRLRLDDRDLRILALLQRDGRITKSRLAELVNLSPSPCWERLKRLEDAGLISGYHARIDLTVLAKTTAVLMEVSLKHHQLEDFDRFETHIQGIEEITDCWATGGGVDYILRVYARDVDAYQRLVDDLLMADIGIDRYFTYIVTKKVKEAAPLPLERLMGPAEEN